MGGMMVPWYSIVVAAVVAAAVSVIVLVVMHGRIHLEISKARAEISLLRGHIADYLDKIEKKVAGK